MRPEPSAIDHESLRPPYRMQIRSHVFWNRDGVGSLLAPSSLQGVLEHPFEVW
jgi:hypothetical protein